MAAECLGLDLDAEKNSFLYIGDSPNDSPMFGFFPHCVGVANVREFESRLEAKPAYITGQSSGAGFAEMAEFLIKSQD